MVSSTIVCQKKFIHISRGTKLAKEEKKHLQADYKHLYYMAQAKIQRQE